VTKTIIGSQQAKYTLTIGIFKLLNSSITPPEDFAKYLSHYSRAKKENPL
jgi:hypothetical protein